MADEERKRYAEEIYKNFAFEIELNQKIVRIDPTTVNFDTPYRVSYFQSIQNDLDFVSPRVRDDMRKLYALLEENNLYIERIRRMGKDAFFSQFPSQFNQFTSIASPVPHSLMSAGKVIKAEQEKLSTLT